MKSAIAFVLLSALGSVSAMETMVLVPNRDNTLFEESAGELSNGAGSQLFFGRTQDGELRRALMAFDLSTIPPGATIISAELSFTVNRTIVGNVTTLVHPVTASWGEGESEASGQQGGGAAAAEDDATWIHRFFPETPWVNAGGDFTASIAELQVGANDTYSVSSDELTALAQTWLDAPENNHGLLLRAEEEAGATAKRIFSRSGSDQPTLTIVFEGAAQPVNVAGLWFDPASPGEGFNIIQSDGATTLFYFGYAANGERLWLVSESITAPITAEDSFTTNLLVGTQGTFEQPGGPESLSGWGTVTVTFSDCETAVFDMEGLDGTKTLMAVKLQGVTGNACEL